MTMAAPARFDRSTQHRRAMIAKIHVAKKQLAMNEDDYRQLLFDTTGHTSAADCEDGELDSMVAALRGKGFQPLPSRKAAGHPMARKARALWISLYHLNVVRNPSEAALEAFAKRQLGCDRLVWARQSHGAKLIEALKDMAGRNGWQQIDDRGQPLSVLQLQSDLCDAILDRLKQAGQVPADWMLNTAAWSLCGIEIGANGQPTADHYSAIAKALGEKLRAAGGIGQ